MQPNKLYRRTVSTYPIERPIDRFYKIYSHITRMNNNNSLPETDSPMYNFNYSLSDMMDLDELLPIERQELEMELLQEQAAAEQRLQQQQQQQMRSSISRGSSRKQVSFDAYVEIELIEPISEMTEEEKHDIWYHRCELEDFKYQARKLCKTEFKSKSSKGGQQQQQQQQESTRGLECYFPQRMRDARRTNDQVLGAYLFSSGNNSEEQLLGQMAEQCNAEARHLALAMGVQDFYEAYFPHSRHRMIQHQSIRDAAFEPTPLRSGGQQPASAVLPVGPSTPLARRF